MLTISQAWDLTILSFDKQVTLKRFGVVERWNSSRTQNAPKYERKRRVLIAHIFHHGRDGFVCVQQG